MRRFLALLVLVAAVAPGTWLRSSPPFERGPRELVVQRLPLPSKEAVQAHLGPFRLEQVWDLSSAHPRFSGYSALVAADPGELLALSDRGFYLRFAIPDPGQGELDTGPVLARGLADKSSRDIEAATFDPQSGTIWIALENTNVISRFAYADGRFAINAVASPPELAEWRGNAGPESLVRLADGRFLVLREGFTGLFERRRHESLIFATDPGNDPAVERFETIGPDGFSPTDAALMPDGRVLVLLRRVVWPAPVRFAGRLAIGDPATIEPGKPWRLREVAKLSSSLPIDNFEGLAILPRHDGRIDAWLISDDNVSVLQRTLLWHLSVDPADLPGPKKKARGKPARILVQPE